MKLTTIKIGGPLRVVRHEPVMLYPGTPVEQVDKRRVRVVLESTQGNNGETATMWALLNDDDAAGFPVGEVVRMTLEVARHYPGSLMPYERREVPE